VLTPCDGAAGLVDLLDGEVDHEAVRAAPCQWFSPGSKNTRSPGRISSIGPPSRWQRPTPSVTKIVCPCGWVCQAVRAPGVKCTLAAANVEVALGAATASM
jgi:hypothetical protein